MFPRYGKQRWNRSEFHNLSRYTALSHAAFRLFMLLCTLADDDGNVDIEADDLYPRFIFDEDIPELLAQLKRAGHIQTYEANEAGKTRSFASLAGWNEDKHPNKQTTHTSNASGWRNPRPHWQDGPINPTKRAPRGRKADEEVGNRAVVESDSDVRFPGRERRGRQTASESGSRELARHQHAVSDRSDTDHADTQEADGNTRVEETPKRGLKRRGTQEVSKVEEPTEDVSRGNPQVQERDVPRNVRVRGDENPKPKLTPKGKTHAHPVKATRSQRNGLDNASPTRTKDQAPKTAQRANESPKKTIGIKGVRPDPPKFNPRNYISLGEVEKEFGEDSPEYMQARRYFRGTRF